KEHIGTIDNFLAAYELESFRQMESKPKTGPMETTPAKAAKSNTSQEQKEREKELKKLKNELRNIETKITETENEMHVLEEKLADPVFASDPKNKDLFFKHSELKKKLDEYMQRWEKTGEKAEAVDA